MKKKIKNASQDGDGMIKKFCYVCEKEIKPSQRYYAIGKDKNGVEFYRHRKCKSYHYKGKKL